MNTSRTTRRSFLKNTLCLGAGVMLNPFAATLKSAATPAASRGSAQSKIPNPKSKILRAFIVSDAHFGWTGADQPAPETQLRAMRAITTAFPDLDLVVDTGDAHHGGNVPDSARGDWTDIIQGGCGASPFYYVMGNHDQKIEGRTNTFASNECRPYYSFDLYGIHFISLPEMMDHSYITDAEFAWLKLDLQLHANATTIAFSHNSLKDTTQFFNDRGYRQLTNSDAMLELFKLHPNVIAWMHGHNHTYEVVPKYNNLYVSNGRIGGFDAQVYAGNHDGKLYGAHNLGGIYTHNLKRPTTFDPDALPAYSCGFGGSPSGQTLQIHHHHLGGASALCLAGAENPVINENPDLKIYTQRTSKNFMQKILSGYALLPNEESKTDHVDPAWDWLPAGGVRIHKRAATAKHQEKGLFAPNHNYSYFLCSPGESYTLTLAARTQGSGGQIATPVCKFFEGDAATQLYETKSAPRTLHPGEQELSWTFDIPPMLPPPPIVTGASSSQARNLEAPAPLENDNLKMSIGVMFSNLTEAVDILSFRCRLSAASESPSAKTIAPAITIDGKKITCPDTLTPNDLRTFPLDAPTAPDSAIVIDAKGNCRVTWHIKRTAPRYQVRNAPGHRVSDTAQSASLPERAPWATPPWACVAQAASLPDSPNAIDAKAALQPAPRRSEPNAPAAPTATTAAADTYIIGPLRNKFSKRDEIVLSPMIRTNLPYLHRTRGIDTFTYRESTPDNLQTEIEIHALTKNATTSSATAANPPELDFISPTPPQKIHGAATHNYANNTLTIQTIAGQTGKISVLW